MAEQVGTQEKPSMILSTHFPVIAAPTIAATVAPTGEDYLHELRVRVPVDLHRQLLSLKILRGKSLAETVSTALDIYFSEHARLANEDEH